MSFLTRPITVPQHRYLLPGVYIGLMVLFLILKHTPLNGPPDNQCNMLCYRPFNLFIYLLLLPGGLLLGLVTDDLLYIYFGSFTITVLGLYGIGYLLEATAPPTKKKVKKQLRKKS